MAGGEMAQYCTTFLYHWNKYILDENIRSLRAYIDLFGLFHHQPRDQ